MYSRLLEQSQAPWALAKADSKIGTLGQEAGSLTPCSTLLDTSCDWLTDDGVVFRQSIRT